MITDPLTGARKPEQTDGPLGGLQIANVIDDLAPNTIPSFANATARNTAYSNWVAAGGVMRKGLKSHTQNDDRYWRYDGSAWQYAGGAPPPIVACTAGAGWSAVSGNGPGVYKDASGLVHLVGAVIPDTTYNPRDGLSHTALVIPSGYRPAAATVVNIAVPAPVNGIVIADIGPDGVVNVIGGTVSSIGAGAGHFLSTAVPYHPTYNRTLPFA